MADDLSTSSPQSGSPPAGSPSSLVIPDELKAQHPDLIELIIHSESMNTEERQYWINILPIMTPEQLQNLQDILTNERSQLAAIDAKYAKDVSSLSQQEQIQAIGEERQKRSAERTSAE